MSGLFNKNMTPAEARNAFFSAVRGKSPAEIERIEEEFDTVSAEIIAKDLKENFGYMTSDYVRKAE